MSDQNEPTITKTGKILTDADIEALADDAQRGHWSLEVTPAVHVEIRHGDPDCPIVGDFLAWMLEAKVFPIRGTGSSSPPVRLSREGPLHDGQWVGVFDAGDWLTVKAWLDRYDWPRGRTT